MWKLGAFGWAELSCLRVAPRGRRHLVRGALTWIPEGWPKPFLCFAHLGCLGLCSSGLGQPAAVQVTGMEGPRVPPAVSDPEGLSRKNLLGNTGTKETGQGRRACQGRCGCGQGHLPRPPVL